MFKQINKNGKEYLFYQGYTETDCIKLCREVEKLNNEEEARIVCGEEVFGWFFENSKKFYIPVFNKNKHKKLAMHDVFVNEKMLNRWIEYLGLCKDRYYILICASEFGTVGIIEA
jgi:hypothetical protein